MLNETSLSRRCPRLVVSQLLVNVTIAFHVRRSVQRLYYSQITLDIHLELFFFECILEDAATVLNFGSVVFVFHLVLHDSLEDLAECRAVFGVALEVLDERHELGGAQVRQLVHCVGAVLNSAEGHKRLRLAEHFDVLRVLILSVLVIDAFLLAWNLPQ